ncbi:MAG: hypothetical protein KJP04_06585 [Arenicella sp.]|nr:hypothetical protein [Arenicella sp.]
MSDLELHQLLLAARAEFDGAIFLVFIVNFLFMAMAIWRSGELPTHSVRCLQAMCLGVGLFFTVRAIAAMMHYRFANALMNQLDPASNPSLSAMQWPSYLLCAAVIIICPLVAMYFLNRAERDY